MKDPAQSGKDAIYAHPLQHVDDFCFDQSVAEVFPDMIQRSVPGYNTMVDNIGQLAQRFAQPDSHIYDLGCSLGAVSLAIRRYLNSAQQKIIAVDNSKAMLERCELHLQAFKSATPVELRCEDIQNTVISNASLVVMNFTLQFIAPDMRADITRKIFDGLRPGGAYILSEKISHPSELGNNLLIDLHHTFKKRNGYSELEISQKRSALEKVMLIDSFDTHQQRLTAAGFAEVVLWFKCFNFCSIIAIKQA